MIVKTAQQIIDAARPAIRHDTDSQVTDPQLLIWLGEHVRGLHSMAARLARGMYTQSARFTLQSGNSVTIQSAPLDSVPANTYLDFRGIDYDISGGYYAPMQPLPFRSRAGGSGRQYMLRGNTIDLFPSQNATGNYRLWYLAAPMTATVPAAITSFNLPEGGDMWLSEALAARSRVRFQQDPTPHLEQQRRCWRDIIKPWLLAREATGGSMLVGRVEGASSATYVPPAAAAPAVIVSAIGDERAAGAPVVALNIASVDFTAAVPALLVVAQIGGVAPTVTGGGLVWSLVAAKVDGTGAVTNLAIYVFKCTPAATATVTVTVTTNDANTTGVSGSLYALTGASGTIPQNANATGAASTSALVTLAAFSSTHNATFGAMLKGVGGGIGSGPGFTAIFQDSAGATGRVQAEWAAGNDTSVDWSWAGADRYVAVAIEIEAAA